MSWLSLDFEFRDSCERDLTLIAACIVTPAAQPRAFWLHRHPINESMLHEILVQREGSTIFSYSCASEARGLMALGVDPLRYKWFDPMIAYRAYINSPSTKMDQTGLLNCCSDFAVSYQHPEEKELCRDLILTAKEFSAEDKRRILIYCAEDTRCLYDLSNRLVKGLSKKYGLSTVETIRNIMAWSEYVACLGVCESRGMPVNKTYIENFASNYKKVKFFFAEQCTYPFYQYNHKDNDYVLKRELFKDYILSKGFEKFWPLTDSEKDFSMDKNAFSEFKHLSPELESLGYVKQILDTIKSFNPERSVFGATIGSDSHSRTYFNPFGSMTGRNQPPASRFLLLMPSAFRSMIQPDPGYAISAVDWSAQEFILGAALSGDDKMRGFYETGDPYLAFAKAARAIPADGTAETHPAMRNLFKSTCLGLQYSMGIEKLKIKLHRDTRQEISHSKAESLVTLHRKTFSKYWAWVKNIDKATKMSSPAFTLDNWPCSPDGKYLTSMRNFPIQGGGASIMRRAIVNAVRAGLPVICAHHDALYIHHKESDTQAIIRLQECMAAAVQQFIGDVKIRTSAESHDRSHDWVEKRARKTYDQLLPFFITPHADVELKNKIDDLLVSEDLFGV